MAWAGSAQWATNVSGSTGETSVLAVRVLTDAHEMGSGSTYFFQPGIPERNNPATPAQVFEFTRRIADYHGELLDQAGEPYYSRESFDDYYLGKGSTYPDLTGGIGILFEQGSVRGHRMDTPYGERTFAEAIANQVRTSISTLEASVDLGDELVAYQADFFSEGREMGSGGWLLGDGGDPMRARRLLETLEEWLGRARLKKEIQRVVPWGDIKSRAFSGDERTLSFFSRPDRVVGDYGDGFLVWTFELQSPFLTEKKDEITRLPNAFGQLIALWEKWHDATGNGICQHWRRHHRGGYDGQSYDFAERRM